MKKKSSDLPHHERSESRRQNAHTAPSNPSASAISSLHHGKSKSKSSQNLQPSLRNVAPCSITAWPLAKSSRISKDTVFQHNQDIIIIIIVIIIINQYTISSFLLFSDAHGPRDLKLCWTALGCNTITIPFHKQNDVVIHQSFSSNKTISWTSLAVQYSRSRLFQVVTVPGLNTVTMPSPQAKSRFLHWSDFVWAVPSARQFKSARPLSGAS